MCEGFEGAPRDGVARGDRITDPGRGFICRWIRSGFFRKDSRHRNVRPYIYKERIYVRGVVGAQRDGLARGNRISTRVEVVL